MHVMAPDEWRRRLGSGADFHASERYDGVQLCSDLNISVASLKSTRRRTGNQSGQEMDQVYASATAPGACLHWAHKVYSTKWKQLMSLYYLQNKFHHNSINSSLVLTTSMQAHRQHLTKQFFMRNVLTQKSSLHYLAAAYKRDLNTVNRLCHAKTFELSQTGTKRFRR